MSRVHRVLAISLVVAMFVGSRSVVAQPCDDVWTADFYDGSVGDNGALADPVNASAVFDFDGDGPRLPEIVIGGNFRTAGGAPIARIAAWNGQRWRRVGSTPDGIVNCLHVLDDDGPGPHAPTLYAGGTFTRIGSTDAARVARWNGSDWEPVGLGFNGSVSCLSTYQFKLVAGGDFTASGATPVARVGLWNGTSWSAFGAGFTTRCDSLLEYDDGSGPTLYAVRRLGPVLRWRDGRWESVGNATSGVVSDMVAYDTGNGMRLCILGTFTSYGGNAARNLAQWDGSSWLPMGGGLPEGVQTFAVGGANKANGYRGELYVAGYFTRTVVNGPHKVARWDGRTWQRVGVGDFSSAAGITCLEEFDDDGSGPSEPTLVAFGDRVQAFGPTYLGGAARLQGSLWLPLGGGAVGSSITHRSDVDLMCASFDADGEGGELPMLYVGGSLGAAGGQPASLIARWDGRQWDNLNGGLIADIGSGPLQDLHVVEPGFGLEPGLYVSGSFTRGGSTPLDHCGRWDGSTWSPVEGGLGHYVQQFGSVHEGPARGIYVGGNAIRINGVNAGKLLRWDGVAWVTPGTGLQGQGISEIRCFAEFDPDGSGPAPVQLFIGGQFDHAGSVETRNIASWNGTSIEAVGGGLWFENTGGSTVTCMAVFDDGGGPALYVGGFFNRAGGMVVPQLIRWNGTAWSTVPGWNGSQPGCLYVHDPDGTGPATPRLYVGGGVSGVSWWDGREWHVPDGGINAGLHPPGVREFAFVDEGPAQGLYASGDFLLANGRSTGNIARLVSGRPIVTTQPWSQRVRSGESVTFMCEAESSSSMSYQWRLNEVPLDDDQHEVLGSRTALLRIPAAGAAHAGSIDVVVTDACGESVSRTATLEVKSACVADFNQNGLINTADFYSYLDAFWSHLPPADIDGNQTIDSRDFMRFLMDWMSGCM